MNTRAISGAAAPEQVLSVDRNGTAGRATPGDGPCLIGAASWPLAAERPR